MQAVSLQPVSPLFPTHYAFSPLWETVNAVRCVLHPRRHILHARWAARHRVEDLRLGVLETLLPASGWLPDFLTPPPDPDRQRHFADELQALLSTPESVVVDELQRFVEWHGAPATGALRRWSSDPARLLTELSRTLARCHEVLLRPSWPQVESLLVADIDHRGTQMVGGGLGSVLADLAPEVTHAEGVIRVRSACAAHKTLDARGLLLMPGVFSWPTVTVYAEGQWRPTLVYRARGVGGLWGNDEASPQALGDLLGRRRALVLQLTQQPRSTTRLATMLGVSPAGVSEHLHVLYRAGLVRRHRRGREQLYSQTALGRDVVRAAAPGDATRSGPDAAFREP